MCSIECGSTFKNEKKKKFLRCVQISQPIMIYLKIFFFITSSPFI